MFYDLALRIAFIHIPRTGGVAVTMAFRPLLGLGGGWDLGALRHLCYRDMQAVIGPDSAPLRWIAIYRPLDHIRASFTRLVERDRAALQNGAVFSPSWTSILTSDDPVGTAWQRGRWPNTENEWWRFWLGPEPAKITVLDFRSLKEDLPALCRAWQIPEVILPEQRVN